ncbi:MAG: hypothetical protein FWG14_12340 [Peptococcaceae bacterium]|nr:hypothetical protein [Peptococcaceae bacterium]
MYELKNLSIRELQMYGAKCIHLFCAKYEIKHKFIDKLIYHLVSIISEENLPKWEKEGSLLELSGRGDPLPEDLNKIIQVDIKNDFYNLVDNVVEIGIVDMYGANTDFPYKFLNNAIKILEKHNIFMPIFGSLLCISDQNREYREVSVNGVYHQ